MKIVDSKHGEDRGTICGADASANECPRQRAAEAPMNVHDRDKDKGGALLYCARHQTYYAADEYCHSCVFYME